jgi:hypothetical protein
LGISCTIQEFFDCICVCVCLKIWICFRTIDIRVFYEFTRYGDLFWLTRYCWNELLWFSWDFEEQKLLQFGFIYGAFSREWNQCIGSWSLQFP